MSTPPPTQPSQDAPDLPDTTDLHGSTRHPRFLLIGTGGTIAGKATLPTDNVGYKSAQIEASELLNGLFLPSTWTIHAEQLAQIDSKDMSHDIWQRLAQRLHTLEQVADQPEHVDHYDAIIITHGTDTLEETAFFLHALWPSPRCPIVLTCAMRPATALLSDGPQNLRDAFWVGLHAATQGIQRVLVVSSGEIHDPVTLQKSHPYQLHAFDSAPTGPVGVVQEERVQWWRTSPLTYAPFPAPPATLSAVLQQPSETWPQVVMLQSHAGLDARMSQALIQSAVAQGCRGIMVIGTGNATLHKNLEHALQQAHAHGLSIWISSRCWHPPVMSTQSIAPIKENSKQEKDLTTWPIVFNLNPAKARIALMLQLL